jgi:hypothetical protein
MDPAEFYGNAKVDMSSYKSNVELDGFTHYEIDLPGLVEKFKNK